MKRIFPKDVKKEFQMTLVRLTFGPLVIQIDNTIYLLVSKGDTRIFEICSYRDLERPK